MSLIALLGALLVQGYVRHLSSIGDDALPASADAGRVPETLLNGGPVVDARNGGLQTTAPPAKTIALTFDDGPDPRWTPGILDILKKHGAHATFFVVGTEAIDHPDLVRRIVADGNEIGVHTLTHVDLGTAPPWRRALELRTSGAILAGITGRSPTLLRPPYSSENSALTDSGYDAIRTAADAGYLTVLSSIDSQDWQRPGVEAIVRNATPRADAGQVLLMHDAGGDRSETVTALDRVLDVYSSRGVRVTSVGDALHLNTMPAVSLIDQVRGAVVEWGIRLSGLVVTALGWALLASGVVTVIRAVLVLAFAARHRRAAVRKAAAGRPWGFTPGPVTVIVPAYNESAGIEAAVRSIALSEHPVEIIVVDDGSTDATADLVEALDLEAVRLIRKENGGKPSALNAGIAAASHELVVMVDGDTVFQPDTVGRLIQPFSDRTVGAVSGNTKIANRGGILGAWQHIEYVVGFNLDRRLFDVAECMPTVPGAIGGFRKSALARVGGVSNDTLAEDTDLTMALCRDGWRVVYQDDALAWTEAPASLGALWKQRYRWCYGTLQAMWKHRAALGQGGQAGKLGRRGILYLLVLQVLLPLLAPVVDVFTIYGLIFLDPVHISLLWLGFLAVQVLMAAYAFRIDGESLKPLWTLPLQQVVYRQLMYLVVIRSLATAVTGIHLKWHRMERYGSLSVPPPRS
ncbi:MULTISPECIES: glycosyltransferase [Arthrobacter]|uniref:Glycosyltransferase n=2 Tax=Arthrobacter TaxID=1663 RepID=A0ABU9KLJ2_9MICC|nr:glycosyltransferase [Arthrobacter sp. YJM1]MDP5227110.1 glycosyltransferase [Arthrobacter sp. YJM1]